VAVSRTSNRNTVDFKSAAMPGPPRVPWPGPAEAQGVLLHSGVPSSGCRVHCRALEVHGVSVGCPADSHCLASQCRQLVDVAIHVLAHFRRLLVMQAPVVLRSFLAQTNTKHY